VMTEQEIDRRLMTLRIIWFALLMSLAVYLFVAIRVGADVQSSINETTFGILRTVLYVTAIAILIATKYVRKLIMSGRSQVGQPVQALEHLALQSTQPPRSWSWRCRKVSGFMVLSSSSWGKTLRICIC
jgi:hypothetical protein